MDVAGSGGRKCDIRPPIFILTVTIFFTIALAAIKYKAVELGKCF